MTIIFANILNFYEPAYKPPPIISAPSRSLKINTFGENSCFLKVFDYTTILWCQFFNPDASVKFHHHFSLRYKDSG